MPVFDSRYIEQFNSCPQLLIILHFTDRRITLMKDLRQIGLELFIVHRAGGALQITCERNIDAQGNIFLNLIDYHARMYDSALMRWTQPDTITGQGSQGLNRFSYGLNNPVKYSDPTGHRVDDGCRDIGCSLSPIQAAQDAQKLAILQYDPTGQKQAANQQLAEKILVTGPTVILSAVSPEAAAGGLIYQTVVSDLFSHGNGTNAIPVTTAVALRPTDWRLGDDHTAQQWNNKMARANWTDDQITWTIQNGQAIPSMNNINPENGATRYYNPNTDASVIVDNTTHEVIMLGGPGYSYTKTDLPNTDTASSDTLDTTPDIDIEPYEP